MDAIKRVIFSKSRQPLLYLFAACAGAALAVAPAPASAQYPDKPIRVIVAYPAGGATDVIARLIGARLGERLKQPIVVENRAGASGMIGSEAVAKAAPDGYTLIYTAADTHSINPHVYPKIAYDARRDFTPIALTGQNPLGLVVKTALPANNVAQLIKLAKDSPGKLTFASWGVGSSSQAAMEMFNAQVGVDLLHVPFQGAAPAIQAVMAGQVDAMMVPLTLAEPNHKAGKVRLLAALTPQRSGAAPDAQTLTEQDVPLSVGPWQGFLGPANLPPAVVALLNREVNAVLTDPAMREQLLKAGLEVSTSTSQDFKALLDSEYERWGKTIRAAKIRVD